MNRRAGDKRMVSFASYAGRVTAEMLTNP